MTHYYFVWYISFLFAIIIKGKMNKTELYLERTAVCLASCAFSNTATLTQSWALIILYCLKTLKSIFTSGMLKFLTLFISNTRC